MNIQKNEFNSNQIIIHNYQVNPTQAYKLRGIGLVMNASILEVHKSKL